MEKPESVQRPSAMRRWRKPVAAVFAAGMIAAGGLVILPSQAVPVASALPCPDGTNTCGPTAPTQDPGPTQGNGGNTTAPQAPNTTIPPNQDAGQPTPPANGNSGFQGTVQSMPTPDKVDPNSCIAGCPTQTAPAPTGTQAPPTQGQQQQDRPTQQPTVTTTPARPSTPTTTGTPTPTTSRQLDKDTTDVEARQVVRKEEEMLCDVSTSAFTMGLATNCRPRYSYESKGSSMGFPKKGDTLLLSCGYKASPCSTTTTTTVSTTTTWTVNGKISGGAEFEKLGGKIAAELGGSYGEAYTKGFTYAVNTGLDASGLQPGQHIYGYNQVREVITYWDRTDAKTGEVVRVVSHSLIPVDGIEGVVG